MKRTFIRPIPIAVFLFLVGLFAFAPNSAASDFFLHSTTNDFLDNTSPTATTAKFKDSAAVNRTTYQEIGTWTAVPAATWMRLSSLSDLHIWIGLKNSDDQGTYFDLRAELRKNGVVIASGETKTIQGVTRNPDLAKEVAVAFGPISGDPFSPGDVLSIKILTKVADSGGHNNAVGLRLYYDAVSRPSKFGALFVVDTTPPSIATVVNPAPNAAGWNKSDATVSFTCSDSESGVASCPAPITVTTEGANQLVSGTATDLAGNSASASMSISLDRTAPTVAITSPSNGATVSSSPVNVTGTATDGLSGIATVLCNGNSATLSAPTFSCDVPLTNGPNTITVEATDVAGNTVSSSITVNLGEPLQPQNPPVVFGPRIFTLPNEAVSFLVTNPAGPFWLQVSNGEAVQHAAPGQPGMITMQNLVTSGEIRLNGSLVAGASDFDHNTTRMFGFQKDVTLSAVNTLEVQLQGPVGSFITVEIREADPNPTVSNKQGDLTGTNMGDQVMLSWGFDDSAAEYVVFRATSLNGPWAEGFRLDKDAAMTGGAKVDDTPDARLMDLCYKVEARDAVGQLIRTYEPICVPKFVEPQTHSFAPQRYSPNIRSASLSPSTQGFKHLLQQAASFAVPYNFESAADVTICVNPEDNYSNGRGFVKEISKGSQGVFEPELNGSFLTFQTWEADPNPTVSNKQGDLTGTNMGDQVMLSWGFDDSAAEYVVFRATSLNGPWAEGFRLDKDAAMTGGAKVDDTPDARLMDLCYKVEARDTAGRIVRMYEPICVPKFIGPRSQSLSPGNPLSSKRENQQISLTSALPPRAFPQNTHGRNSRSPILLASLMLLAAPEPTDPRANELCFGNPDEEFTDFRSRTKSDIEQFLKDRGGFMKAVFRDVPSDESPDGEPIDAAREIFEASQTYRINPEVLLVTLQKEHNALTREDVPPVDILKDLAGWDQAHAIVPKANKSAQEQIWDMAAQFRRDFDKLSEIPPRPTAGGWAVDVPKDTKDPLSVRPASKPVAALYSYTNWTGARFGGRRKIGGNGLFCELWEQYGFRRQPLAISPQNPTLVCGPDASVTFTASGGTPGPDGYRWSITGPNLTTTEGVLTVTGVNKQNVQVKPPDSSGSGVAYRRWGARVHSLVGSPLFKNECAIFGNCSNVFIQYSCNDNEIDIGQCTTIYPCVPDTQLPVVKVEGSDPTNICTPLLACGPGVDELTCLRQRGLICNARQQGMESCKPCTLEMQGTTVTVKDANPNQTPVTTTITVK